jgi:hypothetical protein
MTTVHWASTGQPSECLHWQPAAHGGNALNASGRLPPSWAHSLAGQLDTPLLCNDNDDRNNHFNSPG